MSADPFSSPCPERADKLAAAMREMVKAREAGDVEAANRWQQVLHDNHVSVRCRPRSGNLPGPAGIWIDKLPRGTMDDGSPITLVSRAEYAKWSGLPEAWLDVAVECGVVPCFRFARYLLFDRDVADAALHRWTLTHGVPPTADNFKRIAKGASANG